MDPRPHFLPPGPLTYADYAAIPNDGKRYEILDGELHVSPSPREIHQRGSLNLATLLHAHVRSRFAPIASRSSASAASRALPTSWSRSSPAAPCAWIDR